VRAISNVHARFFLLSTRKKLYAEEAGIGTNCHVATTRTTRPLVRTIETALFEDDVISFDRLFPRRTSREAQAKSSVERV
jgi:hypothetical protein